MSLEMIYCLGVEEQKPSGQQASTLHVFISPIEKIGALSVQSFVWDHKQPVYGSYLSR
jgi:hypothetical protein